MLNTYLNASRVKYKDAVINLTLKLKLKVVYHFAMKVIKVTESEVTYL